MGAVGEPGTASLAQDLERDLFQEFQLREISRHKKIEKKPVEVNTSDIGH
jgi:hypothetical protein